MRWKSTLCLPIVRYPLSSCFGNGIEANVVVEVDERTLLVLQLIQRWGLLEVSTQVSELVVMPNLLKSKLLALLLVPSEVEV